MMDYSVLTEEEGRQLSGSDMVGQGVSREPILVVGEVWRDIVIGGIMVPNQRFIVIRNMVTRVILGADFWVRLGEMTLDFSGRRLKVEKLKMDVEMFETDTPSDPETT